MSLKRASADEAGARFLFVTTCTHLFHTADAVYSPTTNESFDRDDASTPERAAAFVRRSRRRWRCCSRLRMQPGAKSYPTISRGIPDGGNVNVHGTYNHCPQAFFSATPDHAPVGQSDRPDGVGVATRTTTPLTYSWTATAGTIDDPERADDDFPLHGARRRRRSR